MSQKIKLDVVSDVVCPWCIIGYKRLEQAIRELGVEDRIDLEWQPFELNLICRWKVKIFVSI
ncbi:2-hydroxychromene-2-carboxylate isomerase/DsbA-like thioredoxin domain [Vibrio variabilis]|uniref:2-hydroxychromene-2-carboxylate isomerase/DsbA-like thioredoxin domain n=1 Tax=Vibrio variabilis TaxID=990271 RepID=A0ABQ0JLG5_9VIBR|nr:2-hydroxychromene-2-carboxylate isomerase/DsbA-like thioredoxin domain [Vibrio variabilis]